VTSSSGRLWTLRTTASTRIDCCWFGDDCRAHYDDDAPLSLEEAVAAAAAAGRVSEVLRDDRETVMVSSTGRCRRGMLAVAARALLDDHV
jgi:hypothetical protein